MRHVIKAGGSVLSRLNTSFFEALRHLTTLGHEIVIVHGGGPDISKRLDESGIPFEKVDGIRLTDKHAMTIVEETLAGKVNTSFVRTLNKAGFEAVGLSGCDASLFRCSLLNEKKYGLVGKVEVTNGRLLRYMLKGGYIPVICSVGVTADGEPVNINADTAAEAAARSIAADQITFVSDVEGVLQSGQLVARATRLQISSMISEGSIYGGMIPKVEAALSCLDSGINTVCITGPSLEGTMIQKEECAV